MDEAERRNPGLALAGSYREGVSLGEAIASGEEAAARLAAPHPPWRDPPTGERAASRRHPGQRARALADRARARAAPRRRVRDGPGRDPHHGRPGADVPLSQIGSRALFTRQIDDAMLEGRIDLAVHSLKDLPTRLPEGIALVAVGEREDPRDALVGRGPVRWDDLPQGAVLATSSLRRRAQLLHVRPDLQVRDIRGNVDTRLAKLDANSEWSAILLAAAGLVRLGLGAPDRRAAAARADAAGPGPGRARASRPARATPARRPPRPCAVHHTVTALAVAAERAFLRTLEGGCQVPVAAHAELTRKGGSGCTGGSSRSAASGAWRGSRRAPPRTKRRPTRSAWRWPSGCWATGRRRFSPRYAPPAVPAVPEP